MVYKATFTLDNGDHVDTVVLTCNTFAELGEKVDKYLKKYKSCLMYCRTIERVGSAWED